MIPAVIAQIKFVATYMLVSVWPGLLCGGGILASLIMPPPGSEWPFAANVLMWVGIVTMIASLALLLKKLFGRQPSINEILSGLVSVGHLEDYKKEQHLRHRGLEEQISKVRHDTDERMNSDLKRTLESFQDIFRRGEERDVVIGRMRDSMSRLQERTETHIRKFDSLDAKMDRLIDRLQK